MASYPGDGSFRASTRRLLQTVTPAATRLTLTAGPDPSDPGRPVHVTATVAPVPPGAGTPTGTVQFTFDRHAYSAPLPLHDGQAGPPPISGLQPGVHTLEVDYAGDNNYDAATAVAAVAVRDGTQTLISSTPDPAKVGRPVTFWASVFPTHTGGTFSFTADGAALPGCQRLEATDSTAACTTAALAPGRHVITATFDGSRTHLPSHAAP